jgi:hypothetical protein
MAVPADGILPFDGAFPALIQWLTPLHPTAALPDHGLRLRCLTLAHPQAQALRTALPLTDPRIAVVPGPVKALSATFDTPHGPRTLS